MIRIQKKVSYGLKIPQLLDLTPTGTTHKPTLELQPFRAVSLRSISNLESGMMLGVTKVLLMLVAWQQFKLVVEHIMSEQLYTGNWFTDLIQY